MVVIAGQGPFSIAWNRCFPRSRCDRHYATDYQMGVPDRKPEEIAWAVSRAFYIVTGRPGPVVLDLAKDAQVGFVDYEYKKVDYIRSYQAGTGYQPGSD